MMYINEAVNVLALVVFTSPVAFMAMVWVKQCFMGDVV